MVDELMNCIFSKYPELPALLGIGITRSGTERLNRAPTVKETGLLRLGLYGRSPMIAIRVHPLKPAAVIYIQPDRIDELALKIAEIENIPLIVTDMPPQDISRVMSALRVTTS